MFVSSVSWVPSPCVPPFQRPAMLPLESATSRGELTIFASCPAAVEAGAGLLDRQEQQVLVHRRIALPAGTDQGGSERRLLRVRDVPDLQAVVVALEDVVPAEGKVRVDERVLARCRRVEEPGG